MATKNAALRTKMADDFAALWNGGTLVIKDASANTLATFTLEADAFQAAATGVAGLTGADGSGAIGSGNPLTATGTAAAGAGTDADNAELLSTSSTYTITGLTVGVGSGQVQIDNLSIAEDQTVNLTAFTWTESATVS